MPSFESFSAVPAEKKENGNDRERMLSVADRLAKEYPKMRTFIFACIASVAAMGAPEKVQADTAFSYENSTPVAEVESESAERTLSKSAELVRNALQEAKMEVPDGAVYASTSYYEEIDGVSDFEDSAKGELMLEGDNVFVSTEAFYAKALSEDAGHASHGIKESFYMQSVEDTEMQSREVEVVETFVAVGSTQQEALQNALKEVVKFWSTSIHSEGNIVNEVSDTDVANHYSEVITSEARGVIAHYEVTDTQIREVPEGLEYEITIEVTGGSAVSSN